MKTALITLFLSAPAFAGGTAESLRAGAAGSFARTAFAASAPALRFAPAPRPPLPQARPGAEYTDETFFNQLHTRSFTRAAAAPAAAAAQEVELAPLLNKQLRTALTRRMAGAQLSISGAFDRDRKAYVAVSEEGKAARFFEVESLLSGTNLAVGSGQVRLRIRPDLDEPLESEIVLVNTADRSEQWKISLREMFAAVSAQGARLVLHGQEYRVFYYDDVRNGVSDPSSRSFAFITNDAKGEIHFFLVPAELVPSGTPATFKMLGDKAVGLQQKDGKLRVTQP